MLLHQLLKKLLISKEHFDFFLFISYNYEISKIYAIFFFYFCSYMYLPSQESIYKRYIEKLINNRHIELPALIDIIHNVSLILINSHPAIQYPRPNAPNIIQIGGLHLSGEGSLTPLPQEIDEYITAAPDGVIFMSLGSLTKSSDLPAEQIAAFVNVFQTYVGKMRIIWKWENATMLNQPHNVIIGPWLPQEAILGNL